MGKTQSFDRAFEVSFHIVQALLLPRFMADFSPVIETFEHRLMRAWVNRDMRTLKALTSRNFRLVIASKPPILLGAKRGNMTKYKPPSKRERGLRREGDRRL